MAYDFNNEKNIARIKAIIEIIEDHGPISKYEIYEMLHEGEHKMSQLALKQMLTEIRRDHAKHNVSWIRYKNGTSVFFIGDHEDLPEDDEPEIISPVKRKPVDYSWVNPMIQKLLGYPMVAV